MHVKDPAIWAAVAEGDREELAGDAVFTLAERIAEADNPAETVVTVARRFPGLATAAGLDPWSVEDFETWMSSTDCTASGYWAAMLVMALCERKPEAFDLADSETGWDVLDREAFYRLVGQVLHLSKWESSALRRTRRRSW